jgi:hypothetical protein
MTHSPSIIFSFPVASFGLVLAYLLILEPTLVSEEILLFFVSSFFFTLALGLLSGASNLPGVKAFSSSEFGILKFSNSTLGSSQIFWGPVINGFFGYDANLNPTSPQSILVLKGKPGSISHLSVFFFLRTFFKLILPSELDIWRVRFNWFFKLYTTWSELYGFFLNCNFNLFPSFTIPPDYRRIRTWRGRRLI